MWATFIGILVVIVGLMWAEPDFRSRDSAGASPLAHPPVGTTGQQGGEPEDSPATLHDLETLTGAVDPHELIGRRVDFHVKVADINNYASFWVANNGNKMLGLYRTR